MTDGAGLLVVPAGVRDAAALARLHRASFGEAWDEAAFLRLLEAPAARGFIATQGYDTAPVGFVLAFLAADEAEILAIAVDPGRRRSGAGRRLMRALTDALREEGVIRLFLEVATDNVAALGLYRALGFEEAGVRRGYYPRDGGRPADALTLKLALWPPPEDGRFATPSL